MTDEEAKNSVTPLSPKERLRILKRHFKLRFKDVYLAEYEAGGELRRVFELEMESVRKLFSPRKEIPWQPKYAEPLILWLRKELKIPSLSRSLFATPIYTEDQFIRFAEYGELPPPERPKSVAQFGDFHSSEDIKTADDRSSLYVKESIPDILRNTIVDQIAAALSRQGWRLETLEAGQGFTHPDLNLRILTEAPLIDLRLPASRWVAHEGRYHDDLREFALKNLKPGAHYFNAAKIRIASDLSNAVDEIAVEETDYLSSLMTDQLAWHQVRSKKLSSTGPAPAEILWDGTSAFIAYDPITQVHRLKPFGETGISNQLGASTIAFAEDGHMMIVAQNDKNNQSQNMLAPSGSGSLDWSDVSAGTPDLLSLVRYGAERELREECSLNDDESHRGSIASRVIVTGFARMLHRAGKPEFYCLGWIAGSATQICEREPERYVEQVLSADVEVADWSRGRPSQQIYRVCQDYMQKTFVSRGHRVPASYPLEHALGILSELCLNDRAASILDDFIRTSLERSRSGT